MARLILRRHREGRILAGHPWVYRSEVAELVGPHRPDEAVTVLDWEGTFLGRGFYNPRAQIVCRLLTRQDEPIDPAFFRRRLEAAWAYRRQLGLDGDATRAVFSEADRLPGLIVDRYGEYAVLACLTRGMERQVEVLAEAVEAVLGVRGVYRRADPAAARIEGLEGASGWVRGSGAREVEIREGPLRFTVDLEAGQKTGFYLDQRENREAVAARAAGREVLDAFCYTGAFACWALAKGARAALAADTSADALARARRHAEANGLWDRLEVEAANAFDLLRGLERDGRRFDLVILDPPPFTRRKSALESAVRGYKEINLRAFRCLRPGGLLATFSCSHHVSPALFEEVVQSAGADAGVTARLLAALTQARDHPVLLTVPETRYLKGLLLEVIE